MLRRLLLKTEIQKMTSLIVSEMPVGELKARLAECLARTADDLREMAAIVGELEARGEDLDALKLGMIHYLRRIAAGELLPEIVVHFSGNPQVLDLVALLPLSDQRQLVKGEGVEYVAISSGQLVERRIDLLYATRAQIKQVMTAGRLRSKPEQIAYIEGESTRRKPPAGKRRARKITVDRVTREVVVGKMRVPIADLLSAIAEAAGHPGDVLVEEGPHMPHAVAWLTAREKQRLTSLVEAAGLDEREVVRRAILAFLI